MVWLQRARYTRQGAVRREMYLPQCFRLPQWQMVLSQILADSQHLTGANTGCAGVWPTHWAALHLHTRQARGTIWGWPWGGGTCTDPPRGTDPSPSRTCRAACTPAPPSSPPAWAAGSVRPGVVQDREETTNQHCPTTNVRQLSS